MTVYVKSHHATFIHIPKNAGTAISHWLVREAQGVKVGHKSFGGKHAPHARIQATLGHSLGKVIVCVRNPWDRVVSAYHYHMRRGTMEYATFDDFVMSENYRCVRKSMLSFFDTADIVLRYENLNTDFQQVQTLIGSNVPLEIKNESTHAPYYKYYKSQEMIDVVAKKYAKDIDYFGYHFG